MEAAVKESCGCSGDLVHPGGGLDARAVPAAHRLRRESVDVHRLEVRCTVRTRNFLPRARVNTWRRCILSPAATDAHSSPPPPPFLRFGTPPRCVHFPHVHRDWSAQTSPLSGTIPASVGTLTGITSLYLNDNAITGTLPDALASLTKLAYLRAGNNAISGTLPGALVSLTALTELALFGNAITGTLPDALGSLTGLVYLCVATLRCCRRDAPPRRTVVISRSPPLLPAPSLPPPPAPVRSIDARDARPQGIAKQRDHGDNPRRAWLADRAAAAVRRRAAPLPPRSTSPRLAATFSRSPALLPVPFRRPPAPALD